MFVVGSPCAQHFRQLTLNFLKPFTRYFHVDQAKISARLAAGTLGLYDDLPGQCLPKFGEDVRARLTPRPVPCVLLPRSSRLLSAVAALCWRALQEFFAHLKVHGPPKMLAKAQYRRLYQSFIHSCHFWPWFKAKEQVCLWVAHCGVLDRTAPVEPLCSTQYAARKLHLLARSARIAMNMNEVLWQGPLRSQQQLATGPEASPKASPTQRSRPLFDSPPRSAAPGVARVASSSSPLTPRRIQSSRDAKAAAPAPAASTASSVISFLTKFTGLSSATAVPAAPPPPPGPEDVDASVRSLLGLDDVEERLEMCAEMQVKIKSAFIREERLLNKVRRAPACSLPPVAKACCACV